MFQFTYDHKPGQRPAVVSLVDTALTKAASLLHTDMEEGLRYLGIAEKHYENLDPAHPDYKWIEYQLETLFVDYFKKQAGLALLPQSL